MATTGPDPDDFTVASISAHERFGDEVGEQQSRASHAEGSHRGRVQSEGPGRLAIPRTRTFASVLVLGAGRIVVL